MKSYWIVKFIQLFKRKDYLGEIERHEIGIAKSSLIEIAKKVVEEENITKQIDSRLRNKLYSLELKEH